MEAPLKSLVVIHLLNGKWGRFDRSYRLRVLLYP